MPEGKDKGFTCAHQGVRSLPIDNLPAAGSVDEPDIARRQQADNYLSTIAFQYFLE